MKGSSLCARLSGLHFFLRQPSAPHVILITGRKPIADSRQHHDTIPSLSSASSLPSTTTSPSVNCSPPWPPLAL
jgi:hypothetical protein